MAPEEPLPRFFRFASFEVDLKNRELRRDGTRIALQEKPFRLLEALLLARGDLVTRAELEQALWPESRHVAAEMGIHTAARKLRRTLGDRARDPRFIETVPGIGYRLIAAVEAPMPRVELGDEDSGTSPPTSRRRRWITPAATAGLSLIIATVVWTVWPAPEPQGPGSTKIGGMAAASSGRPLPVSKAARRSFLAALHLKARGTPEAAERAALLFEEVTVEESTFAPAHGELALALAHRAARLGSGCELCKERARAALRQALRRSPELPEALLADGILAIHLDWDWRRAETSLERAIALAPRSPEAHLILATWRAITGRHEEALAHVRRAVELDPGSFLVRSDAGFFYLAAGRDNEAAAECRLALEVDPGFLPARRCLLAASERLGGLEEAARQARFLMSESGASENELASLDRAAGQERLRLFRRWSLQRLEASPTASPVSYAAILARLGEEQDALLWLERAFTNRHPEVVFFPFFSEFRELRDRPEVAGWIEKVGWPQGAEL